MLKQSCETSVKPAYISAVRITAVPWNITPPVSHQHRAVPRRLPFWYPARHTPLHSFRLRSVKTVLVQTQPRGSLTGTFRFSHGLRSHLPPEAFPDGLDFPPLPVRSFQGSHGHCQWCWHHSICVSPTFFSFARFPRGSVLIPVHIDEPGSCAHDPTSLFYKSLRQHPLPGRLSCHSCTRDFRLLSILTGASATTSCDSIFHNDSPVLIANIATPRTTFVFLMVFFTKPFPAHDLLHYLMSHFLHCYKNITNYIFILSLLSY